MNELPSYHIDEPDAKPFEAPTPPPSEQPSAELEQYTQEAQALVDSYRRFFTTFAGDVSLDFKLGEAFFIDLEQGEVNLASKWFADKEFSREQILWACLHELAHFRDLSADPERMLKNFEYVRAQAKDTGAVMMEKWEQTVGTSDPEFLNRLRKQMPVDKKNPGKTMNATEQAAYKIHHTFYNIFDDVYVNNLVARRAPRFEKKEAGGDSVKELYKEKLFKEKEYQEMPRHLQFLYTLLREEMVNDEEVEITDEVQQALSEPIQFQGKEYTARQIVETFIKPRAGRDTKAGQRYFVLQHTLEPIFQELLRKDLEEWQPKKPEQGEFGDEEGEPQAGEGNPFAEDYKEFDENNPDKINEEDIKDWMKKNEQENKEKKAKSEARVPDENKTAEEKAAEGQEALDKEWCAKHSIAPETLNKFRQIEREVEPYLQELSELWRKIIFGESRIRERGVEGHFREGTELDIQRTIEQWPQIEKGELDQVEVMKKMVVKEVLIQKPDLIRVRLIGDMSGSMNQEKIHTLQQCFVLILSSLREFNTYLNLSRTQTKSRLEADTEGWVFGDQSKKVKRLRSESGIEDEQVEVVRVFEQLQSTLGNTFDNKALEAVLNSLTEEDRTKIEQEKTLEILFEVTDGGSSDAASSRKAVDQLLTAGVVTRAFQIGQVNDEERRLFHTVWNTGREDAHGEVVGENIENLIPAITAVLKDHLKNVRL